MAARFSKVVVRDGIYSAPAGETVIDPPRMKAWAEKFRRMKAAGFEPPVAWGHFKDALPVSDDEKSSRQFYLSRFNAGYLEDLAFDEKTGELAMKFDAPGLELSEDGKLWGWTKLPDGREVKTAIKQVSLAAKDWKDGQGRHWPDSIVHVALTPMPVDMGQTGFQPLPAGGTFMSLSLDAPGVELSTEATVAEDTSADTPAAGADKFKTVLELLRSKGIVLPDDTTTENAWERLEVALMQGGDEPPPEGEPETGADGVDAAGPTEEPRPVMMSLATATAPRDRKLLEREQRKHREAQVARLDKVARFLRPERAARLRADFTEYQLSLDEDLEPVAQAADRELSLVEELVRELRPPDMARKGVRPAARPDERAAVDVERVRKEAAQRAAAVSVR